MSDRLWLILYLIAVLGVTLVHQIGWLTLGFAAAFILVGPMRWRLLKRAVLAVLLFNLTVSLGYWVLASWRGEFHGEILLLINLRVLLLIYLGFCFVQRINLAKALSFSRTLSFLTTLAAGQIQGFRKVATDFAQAFISRSPTTPGLRARMRFATAQCEHLLDRSVHASTEIGQAMRSRGCFDD
jgi:cobalt/nickel transport system permease protein